MESHTWGKKNTVNAFKGDNQCKLTLQYIYKYLKKLEQKALYVSKLNNSIT